MLSDELVVDGADFAFDDRGIERPVGGGGGALTSNAAATVFPGASFEGDGWRFPCRRHRAG